MQSTRRKFIGGKFITVVAGLVTMLLLSDSLVAQSGVYPAARSGGNYMVNFYFPPSPSSTPWSPAWSPDGQWLAVACRAVSGK